MSKPVEKISKFATMVLKPISRLENATDSKTAQMDLTNGVANYRAGQLYVDKNNFGNHR